MLERLATSSEGLTAADVEARLEREGRNILQENKEKPWWSEALSELAEPMIVLLLVIGVLYSIWGRLEDAVTIFAVILALVAVEVYNDLRADKAIEALGKLAEPTATVRREGSDQEVSFEDIVPGDVLVLEAGRRVPADARLLKSYGLAVDEAPLTGESVPQEKEERPVPSKAPLA